MDPTNLLVTWGSLVLTPLKELGLQIMGFLPLVITALIVLMVGMIIIRALTTVTEQVLSLLKVDHMLKSIGVTDELKKLGITISLTKLLTKIVQIFLVLVLLVVVIDILGIQQLNDFINQILAYIPNVFVAIVILAFGMAIGKIVQDVSVHGTSSLNLSKKQAGTLGQIANAAIIIFSLMAALVQLGIAQSLIETFFTGVVAMFAIAGGIAFGLGGKDRAGKLLDKIGK